MYDNYLLIIIVNLFMLLFCMFFINVFILYILLNVVDLKYFFNFLKSNDKKYE